MGQRYIIPSLDRAVHVLSLLAEEDKGLKLADLERRSGIPKSTLFRILTTLQHRNCVQWSENDRCYRLGYYLWVLGRGYIDHLEPYRVAERHMNSLCAATGETVFMACLEANVVVYLRRVDGTKAVAMMRNLGQSTPIYCTASGRAIVAFLPTEEADRILDTQDYVAHNEKTVTDREAIESILDQVRRLGYAIVDAEYNKDLLCISAPVFDHENHPCAALTLAMLSSQRSQTELIQTYAALVKENARAFSRDLGCLERRSELQTVDALPAAVTTSAVR